MDSPSAEEWAWAFDILNEDVRLGRPATAEDVSPLSPQQAKRRADAGMTEVCLAIRSIYQQVPVLQDLLGIELHVDHIKPIAAGGSHHPSNLQIVPKEINARKSDKRWVKYDDLKD